MQAWIWVFRLVRLLKSLKQNKISRQIFKRPRDHKYVKLWNSTFLHKSIQYCLLPKQYMNLTLIPCLAHQQHVQPVKKRIIEHYYLLPPSSSSLSSSLPPPTGRGSAREQTDLHSRRDLHPQQQQGVEGQRQQYCYCTEHPGRQSKHHPESTWSGSRWRRQKHRRDEEVIYRQSQKDWHCVEGRLPSGLSLLQHILLGSLQNTAARRCT